jgi:hypothetical protein
MTLTYCCNNKGKNNCMYACTRQPQCYSATVLITAVIVFVKSVPKDNVMGNVKLYITAVKKNDWTLHRSMHKAVTAIHNVTV